MNDNYINPELLSYEDEEEPGVVIMDVFRKMLRRWKFILVVSCVFGFLGIVVALLTPHRYSVSVVLAPENEKGSTSSSLGSLASLAGVNLNGSSVDALNITMFPQICSSSEFLSGMFGVELTPWQSPEDVHDGVPAPKPVTVFEHFTRMDKIRTEGQRRRFEKASKKYYEDDSVVDQTQLTMRQSMAVDAMRESISADVDNKTGITTVTVTMEDRLMAAQLADTVCARLQDFIIDYRTKKAKQDYEYYSMLADEAHEDLIKAQSAYAVSVDYDRSVILQSVNSEKERLQQEAQLANQIYTQMVQQRELAKGKIQEARPSFAVIQPGTVPQKANNSRKQVVLIWGFIGFFLSCVWAGFGQDFVAKLREGLDEEIEGASEEAAAEE